MIHKDVYFWFRNQLNPNNTVGIYLDLLLFQEATLVSGVKIHLFQVSQRDSFIWSSSWWVMPLKCHRDKSLRKKEGWQASTGSHRQHCVWGRELHFRGTAGLKVKDYFEICIPTIKLSYYIPPSLPPPSSLQPSLPLLKNKKLSPQSRGWVRSRSSLMTEKDPFVP